MMVWQDCYCKILISLFIHLLNRYGLLHCIRRCLQAGDTWQPVQNARSKRRKQRIHKSVSKYPQNLQTEIIAINKIQHREWRCSFKCSGLRTYSEQWVTHSLPWPGNVSDRFLALGQRISFFFFSFYNHLRSSLTNYHFIPMVQHRKHFLASSLDFLLWEFELLTRNLLSSRPYLSTCFT